MTYELLKAIDRRTNFDGTENFSQYQRRILEKELLNLEGQAVGYFNAHYRSVEDIPEIINKARTRILKAKSVAGVDYAMNKARREIIKSYMKGDTLL